ncbi:MAG TPA: pyridoxamine 5'-phosphate oxidase family protein [Candidatus Saccharimonadales bacterium]|nr:pyridoxamine 5'-phosphate oxidase family protein [Candidatus Saccharimonadales bacterium]
MKSVEEIYDFMNSYTLGVISTINKDGLPSSAIVGFGQMKDLAILFGTDNASRKYANLKQNPHVAFTIGGETAETVQVEGRARELDSEELHLVRDNYWQKNPHAKVHHQNPSERYFMITPSWIRYTDLRVDPWSVTEIKL